MPPLLSQSFIDELLSRVDIVQVIKVRIKLSRAGQNYKGLCPFHKEKTPSFTVYQNKQYYHCFGCKASGNVIHFLKEYDRLEFREAIDLLAAQVGLEVPSTAETANDENNRKKNKEQMALLAKVAAYYHNRLNQNQLAQRYLDKRGLSTKTIKQYQIGFAPTGWHNLLKVFTTKQQNNLTDTGMLIRKDKKTPPEYFDRFRNRIMFPIRNTRGHIIGFGGRTLGDDLPKYINSPETIHFHKSLSLYGLYEAKKYTKSLDTIFVVEGYMDVIVLAEFGITNAVATLGTAISTKHLQLLLRYTNHIIFCFDGDTAGRSAAWRALKTALPFMNDGLRIHFMFLPEGQDPDSLIRLTGQTEFLRYAKAAESLADFFFKKLVKHTDQASLEEKARLAKKSKELLQKLPNGIFRSLMIDRLAKTLKLDKQLLDTYCNTSKTIPLEIKRQIKTPPQTKILPPNKQLSLAYKGISLLLQNPSLIDKIPHIDITDNTSRDDVKLFISLVNLLHNKKHLTAASIIENWRGTDSESLINQLINWPHIIPESAWEAELLHIIKHLERQEQQDQIRLLLRKAKEQTLTEKEKSTLQTLLVKNKSAQPV